MLKRTFAEDDVHRILSIQARPSHPDFLRWGSTPFVSYTLKSDVWNSIGYPLPPSGFSVNSVFLNFHYLLECSKNKNIDWSLRRSFPWVLWHLWKAREDAGLSFQVNYPEAPPSIPTVLSGPVHYSVWKKPRAGDLKCNVASSWINWQTQSGAS
ncbi:hypothetical protein F2Q68_00002258 [Brassica cretica]|uniref:Reverse transcriptase zinc-binding domain-containing protein n=1 Tax=Brassica cretica TaxID=69181 RepID=A0A8S9JAW5_BRACR|nr:hypothetical protein F2Q68_00002258 [Brassica cretica]